jgi:hypothetical protein
MKFLILGVLSLSMNSALAQQTKSELHCVDFDANPAEIKDPTLRNDLEIMKNYYGTWNQAADVAMTTPFDGKNPNNPVIALYKTPLTPVTLIDSGISAKSKVTSVGAPNPDGSQNGTVSSHTLTLPAIGFAQTFLTIQPGSKHIPDHLCLDGTDVEVSLEYYAPKPGRKLTAPNPIKTDIGAHVHLDATYSLDGSKVKALKFYFDSEWLTEQMAANKMPPIPGFPPSNPAQGLPKDHAKGATQSEEAGSGEEQPFPGAVVPSS